MFFINKPKSPNTAHSILPFVHKLNNPYCLYQVQIICVINFLKSVLFWKINFYTHVTVGGIPLLIGWTQFSSKLRAKYMAAHRLIGKIYVITFLITSLAGFFIAFYATGGFIPALGFGTVALIALFTTSKAYLDIRKGDIKSHQKMMIYSYACCLAAVSLRIWQPLLTVSLDSFELSYPISAWASWLLNLGIAYLIVRRNEKTATLSV